jgi:hypothetical protein
LINGFHANGLSFWHVFFGELTMGNGMNWAYLDIFSGERFQNNGLEKFGIFFVSLV